MKKTLSIALVAIMLLCMMPVFGIFAAEASDVTTIATADEYLAFVASVNAGTFTGKQVEVTADIDLTGKEYAPINNLNGIVIDFKGNTLSGINYTNEAAGNDAGMIANAMTNSGVQNLVLKDCSMTVKREGNDVFFGAVVGWCNSSFVTDITLENVTMKSEASGMYGGIGGLIGAKDGLYPGETEMANIVLKNVTFEAPFSDAALVISRLGTTGLTVKNVEATDVAVNATNAVDETTSVYNVICFEGNNGLLLESAMTLNGIKAAVNGAEFTVEAIEEPTDDPTDEPVDDPDDDPAETTTAAPATTAAPSTTAAPATSAPAANNADNADDGSSILPIVIVVIAVVAVVAVVVVVVVKKKND